MKEEKKITTAKKTTTKKVSSTKATTKKVAAKPAAKKTAAKKVEAKPAVKKTATKKVEAKPAVKKTVTKKVEAKPAVKKTVTKKVEAKPAVKKTVTKKVEAKPAVKKTETKKVEIKPVAKKTVTKKVEVKPEVKKTETKKVEEVKVTSEKNESIYNRKLIMRSVLLMSYTLIIVFLVIGFVDSLTRSRSPKVGVNVSSYITTNNLLDKSNIIELEDASFKLGALNGNYFVYVTYTDKNVNAFEKNLVDLINKKNIKDKFYYINIDKIKDDENVTELVNKYLNFKDALVTTVPTVIYVNKDNILRTENIISRNDGKVISINDVESLLDRNGF